MECHDEEKIDIGKALELVEDSKDDEMWDVLVMCGLDVVGPKCSLIEVRV